MLRLVKRAIAAAQVALLGVYSYLSFVTAVLIYFPLLAAATVRGRGDPTRRLRGHTLRQFGRFNCYLSPIWRFSVDGKMPPDILTEPYVVVANHESTADPFLLSFLPWDMRFISKDEVFRLPLLGWFLRLGGDIRLRRGERESVKQMFEECHRTLAGKLPVMFFPEGTRSPDGNLLPFKDGAFQLAIEAQVPVLPIALAGTRQCRPKGSIWFGYARARARVLEAVATKGMTPADLPRLRELVRDRIAKAARELRAELGLHSYEAGSVPHPPKGGAVSSA